ncbi:MAG: YcxB family protein [Bacteroidota bacterium]
MIVKTRKYKLPTKTYVGIALTGVLKQQWWVILIYLALCCGYFLAPSLWWIIGATIALALYVLFWVIQFYGLPQLEQGKFMFEKLSYEINSQQILIKLNSKQGMPVKWDAIKRVAKGKDYYALFMNKAQIIHLPRKIFNTENEYKFLETILKRKNLIQE